MASDHASTLKGLNDHALDLGKDICEPGAVIVFGTGPAEAELVIVGEAPAERDEATGQPFSGPAGRLLRSELEQAGISTDRMYLTNLVKCRPTELVSGHKRNRTPNRTEISDWNEVLREELSILHPRAILCVGALAAKSIIGKEFKLAADHGTWFDGPDQVQVTATYHPAYILRLEEPERTPVIEAFRSDLARVRDSLESPSGGGRQLSLFE